jgi:hypothetical protein
MLTGNESGGFVYYQIEYPGGKAALTVDASFSADVSVGDMIGFTSMGPTVIPHRRKGRTTRARTR